MPSGWAGGAEAWWQGQRLGAGEGERENPKVNLSLYEALAFLRSRLLSVFRS